jgi:hypothetical protein
VDTWTNRLSLHFGIYQDGAALGRPEEERVGDTSRLPITCQRLYYAQSIYPTYLRNICCSLADTRVRCWKRCLGDCTSATMPSQVFQHPGANAVRTASQSRRTSVSDRRGFIRKCCGQRTCMFSRGRFVISWPIYFVILFYFNRLFHDDKKKKLD